MVSLGTQSAIERAGLVTTRLPVRAPRIYPDNPHVRICGGPGSATTLVYPTPRGRRRRCEYHQMNTVCESINLLDAGTARKSQRAPVCAAPAFSDSGGRDGKASDHTQDTDGPQGRFDQRAQSGSQPRARGGPALFVSFSLGDRIARARAARGAEGGHRQRAPACGVPG